MTQKRNITCDLPFHWRRSEIELYHQLVGAGFSTQQAREGVEQTIRGEKRMSEFRRLVDKPKQTGKEEWWRLQD
jgi:hypothetical protein